jgi:hypothetical protein
MGISLVTDGHTFKSMESVTLYLTERGFSHHSSRSDYQVWETDSEPKERVLVWQEEENGLYVVGLTFLRPKK